MAESFVAFVDPSFDFNTRLDIGKKIIEYIQKRTVNGRGIGGDSFGKYSKAYQETREFKIAKSGETKVNLTLTGDMLDSIEVLDASVPGRIEIGINDGPEADKASFMKDKGYDFLGMTQSEVDDISSDFASQSDIEKATEAALSESAVQSLLRGIFGS